MKLDEVFAATLVQADQRTLKEPRAQIDEAKRFMRGGLDRPS